MSDTENAIAKCLIDLADNYLYKQETVQRMARFFDRELSRFSPDVIRRATEEVIRTHAEFPRVSQVVEVCSRLQVNEQVSRMPEAPIERCQECKVSDVFMRDPDSTDKPEYVAYVKRFLNWDQVPEFKHQATCSRRRNTEWPLPDEPRSQLRVLA